MTIPSGMLLAPANTGRPVDSRWQRVTDLADRGEPAGGKYDDVWVRRGLDFELRRRASPSEAERELLARYDPDVHSAYELRHSSDKLRRGEVEARLLCGQAVEQVASLCGLVAGAVAAYSELFFDVQGRLSAKIFLLVEAVGEQLWDGSLGPGDTDILLKWIAAIKGVVLLDVMLRFFKVGIRAPDRLEGATADQLHELVLMLQARALVVARISSWPGCMRGLRLCELAEELREAIGWLTGASDAPAPPLYLSAGYPHGVSAPPALAGADIVAWWSAWRESVEAAA